MLRKIRALKHSPVAATLIGLVAPVAWAMNVPIMRAIVEGFGMAPGECLLYAMATVIVALSLRIPDVKAADKRYLVFGIRHRQCSCLYDLSGVCGLLFSRWCTNA